MDREELRALIAQAMVRHSDASWDIRFDHGASPEYADSILTALDEAGVQCTRPTSAGQSEEVDFNLPPHMDPDFVAAWAKMEDDGYQYSVGNVAKVHLGWLMARKYAALDLPTIQREARREALEEAAKVAECAFDDRPNSRVGHHSDMDWTDGYRDGTRHSAAAIRALKEGAGDED